MRRANRRALAIVAVLILASLCAPWKAFAHQDRKLHNQELEQVLFNDSSFSRTHARDAQGRAIVALETAAAVCIDQYGQTGTADLLALKEYGVIGLPKSVAEINPENYNLSPTTHRSYSHRGWETRFYPTKENQRRFETRRRILLDTANVALDFGAWHKMSRTYTEQCDSFCALIYYIHILGDYREDITSSDYKRFNGQGNGIKMAFARLNASDDNPDMFWEITKHLGVLFSDHADDRLYTQLVGDLDNLGKKSRRIIGTKDGVDNYEDYEAIKECVNELWAILAGDTCGDTQYANRIHMLLVNEEFFTEAFPSA